MMHMQAAKYLLRYLQGTKERGLLYRQDDSASGLQIFVDAAFADDPDTRRSTTGFVCLYNGCPISWKTARQTTVATSTTEAECTALFAATSETLHLQGLFKDFGIDLTLPTVINEDNTPAITLANNPGSLHGRAKHFQVKLFFVREVIQQGLVTLHWVGTKQQVADGLTKALGTTAFKFFQNRVTTGGIVPSKEGNKKELV
jgi:hypothetical protein